jgi:hypothetical protein
MGIVVALEILLLTESLNWLEGSGATGGIKTGSYARDGQRDYG